MHVRQPVIVRINHHRSPACLRTVGIDYYILSGWVYERVEAEISKPQFRSVFPVFSVYWIRS